MRFSLRPVFAAAMLAMALSPTANSATFTVGVESIDYMPIYKGEGGNFVGYSRELLDAFAAKAGHQFVYKPFPVARLYDEFAVQKSLDFKFPDNPMWNGDIKKNVKVSYSAGAIAVEEGLLVLPANKGKPLSAISKISTPRGFTPYPYMDQIKSKAITVSEALTAEATIAMAEAGRVDGAYLSQIIGNYLMNEVMKKPGLLAFDEKLPRTSSDFSLSTIEHPEVVKQFTEFLTKETATVAKLKEKYKIKE